MAKKHDATVLAQTLLGVGEEAHEESDAAESSPLDIALRGHVKRHHAFCDEVEKRLFAAMRSPNRRLGK